MTQPVSDTPPLSPIPLINTVSYPGTHGLNWYRGLLEYVGNRVMQGAGTIGWIKGEGLVYHLALTAYDRASLSRYGYEQAEEVWLVLDFPEE